MAVILPNQQFRLQEGHPMWKQLPTQSRRHSVSGATSSGIRIRRQNASLTDEVNAL